MCPAPIRRLRPREICYSIGGQREGEVVVVALNLGAEPVSIASDAIGLSGEILLSTFLDRQGEKIHGALNLRGDEGVIVGAQAG